MQQRRCKYGCQVACRSRRSSRGGGFSPLGPGGGLWNMAVEMEIINVEPEGGAGAGIPFTHQHPTGQPPRLLPPHNPHPSDTHLLHRPRRGFSAGEASPPSAPAHSTSPASSLSSSSLPLASRPSRVLTPEEDSLPWWRRKRVCLPAQEYCARFSAGSVAGFHPKRSVALDLLRRVRFRGSVMKLRFPAAARCGNMRLAIVCRWAGSASRRGRMPAYTYWARRLNGALRGMGL